METPFVIKKKELKRLTAGGIETRVYELKHKLNEDKEIKNLIKRYDDRFKDKEDTKGPPITFWNLLDCSLKMFLLGLKANPRNDYFCSLQIKTSRPKKIKTKEHNIEIVLKPTVHFATLMEESKYKANDVLEACIEHVLEQLEAPVGLQYDCILDIGVKTSKISVKPENTEEKG